MHKLYATGQQNNKEMVYNLLSTLSRTLERYFLLSSGYHKTKYHVLFLSVVSYKNCKHCLIWPRLNIFYVHHTLYQFLIQIHMQYIKPLRRLLVYFIGLQSYLRIILIFVSQMFCIIVYYTIYTFFEHCFNVSEYAFDINKLHMLKSYISNMTETYFKTMLVTNLVIVGLIQK